MELHPHFIATPGYVYAYAYGQLLSVYAKFEAQGDAFVPNYLDMLRAGGSMKPEDLTALVDCDLTDPGFWSAGLDIVEQQLTRASQAPKRPDVSRTTYAWLRGQLATCRAQPSTPLQ